MVIKPLELLFLVPCWVWIISAALFLRNTVLPRLPLASPPADWPVDTVTFHATDGVPLAGWKIPADPERPWIILCHGLGTNRSDLLDAAAGLRAAGFNLFLFDFRGHGTSGGRATSFGWHEQRDLEGALVYLGSQPDIPDRSYGIYGVSMGAVVAVLVAARDERLGALVLDSPFEHLDASLGRHLQLLYRLPRIPFLFFIRTTYRLRFGVWPSRVAPETAISRVAPRPVFLIHGAADPRTPLDTMHTFLANLQPPKEVWIVPDAGHLEAMMAHPDEYMRRLMGFLTSHLARPPSI